MNEHRIDPMAIDSQKTFDEVIAESLCTGDACPIDIPVMKPDDKVNRPSHYTRGGIECIEAIKASMIPDGFQDYCKGNVLKYIWRWREKGGIEDLKKARVYLNWLIDSAEEAGGNYRGE